MAWAPISAICPCGDTFVKKAPNGVYCRKCRISRARAARGKCEYADRVYHPQSTARDRVCQNHKIFPDSPYWIDETWTEPQPVMVRVLRTGTIRVWQPWRV